MGKNVTVYLPDDVAEKMEEFKEVNWSEICRKAILDYLVARKSVNPVVATRIKSLEDQEWGGGYDFGLRLCEELVKSLSYDEIANLMSFLKITDETDAWGDYEDVLLWLEIAGGYSRPWINNKQREELENEAEVKGSYAWLLNYASKKKGFRKNNVFVEGMLRAIIESLHCESKMIPTPIMKYVWKIGRVENRDVLFQYGLGKDGKMYKIGLAFYLPEDLESFFADLSKNLTKEQLKYFINKLNNVAEKSS